MSQKMYYCNHPTCTKKFKETGNGSPPIDSVLEHKAEEHGELSPHKPEEPHRY